VKKAEQKVQLEDITDHVASLLEQHPSLLRRMSSISNPELVALIGEALPNPPEDFAAEMCEVITAEQLWELLVKVQNLLIGRPFKEVEYATILLIWQGMILSDYERRGGETEDPSGKALREYVVERYGPLIQKVLDKVRRFCTRNLNKESEPHTHTLRERQKYTESHIQRHTETGKLRGTHTLRDIHIQR